MVLPAVEACRGARFTLHSSGNLTTRVAAILVACALVSAHPRVEPNRDALVLLADKDYPPLSYLDDGTPRGLDVDVATAISETLGRDVRVVLMDWDVAQDQVLRGEADGLLSMSVSPARQALFDFTDSTASHEFGIFVPRGVLSIRGVADLAGKRVGVTRGGLPRRILESHSEVSLVFISNYEDGFERLTAGTLEAVAADRWVGSYTLERRHLRNIVTTGPAFSTAASGIAVKRGNTGLRDEINGAIRQIKANGRLGEIQDRWEPHEVLFVSRERLNRIFAGVLGGVVAALFAAMAFWLFSAKKHARGRRAVECALVASEQRLRHLLADAETELAERKQAERRLRLLAHALQSASDCICITDTGDAILYVNEAFLQTYEYSDAELIGQHISIVRSDNNREVTDGIVGATQTEGWRGTLWNRSRSGRVFPVSLATSMVHDEHGTVVAAVGVARDMTREMAAEESLRETEVKYREVVENANDVIFTVDSEGYCSSMNRAGREITGYVAQDARGVHLGQIVAPAHAAYAVAQLKRVLDGEVVPTFELEILSKEGRSLTLELDVRPYGEGNRSGVQGIARDVTARKELEQQLRQAQKMEAIGRLAGGIAHDFNNLLTVIVGYSELVSGALAPDDALRDDVAEIQRAASSAESLTRQLLIFSRKDVVQTVVLDLNEIVDRLERMLRRIVGEDIEFIVRQARGLGRIKADAGQIEQVVMNLVVNARDAMPTGGMLTVETATVELDDVFERAHPGATAGTMARLTVADTGHGMTPDVQAQIFTPFFTTKGPSTGTGLGLATVHGIVQQSGGWIGVESAIGKGTRFSIYWPQIATSADLLSGGTAAGTTAGTAASGTILFVEDDESIRALGVRTLRQQGFTVIGARHAAEALQLADDQDRRIDLLLTDIVLPGLSGRELASRLHESRPDLKVLYTSGYTDDVSATRDIRANGPGFIQKPYSPDSLARRVRAILSSA
jgi:two-component system cell cycle sensor histidine kinase/response regulator CckA